MGNFVGCVGCIEREREQDAQPLDSISLESLSLGITEAKSHIQQPCDGPTNAAAENNGPHINATKSQPSVQCEQAAKPREPDTELQNHINAVMNARKSRCQQSPVIMENRMLQSPATGRSDHELQSQISSIVAAHSQSLKQQRLALSGEMPSPSPTKSFTDEEIGYYANMALYQASARNTPSMSPEAMYMPWETQPPMYTPWEGGEHVIAPCQLNFADYDDDVPRNQQASTAAGAPQGAPVQAAPATLKKSAAPCSIECTEEPTLKISDIPSPTRNRAKKAKMLWSDMDEENTKPTLDDVHRQYLESKLEQRQTEQSEEEIRLREREAAKKQQEAEMLSMDKMCVDAFLESVKRCAWREKVRTPIKGTNLYIKHMRPARPVGSSVDVKDSSFRCLGNFLGFLESEGLLALKPGLTDPVVSEIYFDACHKYRYVPRLHSFKNKDASVTFESSPAPLAFHSPMWQQQY